MRRIGLLLALLAICSLVIVACGDDDDDEVDTTSTATEVSGAAGEEATDAVEQEATEVEADASPSPILTPTLPPEDQLPATATEPLPPESALIIPPERDESIPRDGRVLGDPDAPVSIVEYGDFQ